MSSSYRDERILICLHSIGAYSLTAEGKEQPAGAAASLSLVLPLKSCLAVDEMFVFVFYLEMKYCTYTVCVTNVATV